MKILDSTEVLQELCKATGKWGMKFWVRNDDDVYEQGYINEFLKAAPWLNLHNAQVMLDGQGWVLFDTQEEMVKTFYLTVGKGGPTSANTYDGEFQVSALTCNPNGQLLNENM